MSEMDYRVPVPDNIKKKLNDIGGIIGESLPEGWGFGLLIFQFGAKGTMAWITNGGREDMILAMKDFIAQYGGELPGVSKN